MLNQQQIESLNVIQSEDGSLYFGSIVGHAQRATITNYLEISGPVSRAFNKEFFIDFILQEHAETLENILTLEGNFTIAKKGLSDDAKFLLKQTLEECKHHLGKAHKQMEITYIKSKMK